MRAAKVNSTTQLSPLQRFTKVVPTLIVVGILGAGWLAVHELNTGAVAENEQEEGGEADLSSDTVTLPPGKLEAGGFESIPVGPQSVQHVHTVPGRLRYDETKHVDLKAPMDGILTECLVAPGDLVESGEILAVLSSSEIGQARAEILRRRKESEIARQILDRETALFSNLQQLLDMLDQGRSVEEIKVEFTGKPLGTYRQQLLANYARLLLATELLENVMPLGESGAIPGRTIREREAEKQVAEAEFRTARDQATFTAQTGIARAEADVSEAERQLDLAIKAVETLLGYRLDNSALTLDDDAALSRLEIRAPFAGTVEYRAFASDERVARGESIMVLANTDSLYVAASIRESDWSVVSLRPGTQVTVSVPALEDRRFQATIRYFGREVAADTNSIPLIASIDNSERLLRPGMFVRVSLPIGASREALSVKPESLLQHESQQFVFVDLHDGSFRRVDVGTGLANEDWVEVTQGLQPGQLVVTHGAFLLKSELLLQGETE
jgi:cobalt-zinc-cadmium efflux system membrane fusion protein